MKAHQILINGECVPVDGIPIQTTLLDLLRDRGLTGAKEGCAEGECGACTIAMVAPSGTGSAYHAVNSCLMFVSGAIDREFYTVESLAQNGELAEVQQVMAAAGGSQCGYCTPGFIMSLFAEQYRPGRAGSCDPHALSGNLCRCTGYRPIRDAALSVGPAPEGPFLRRLALPAPPLQPVHITGFERPGNLAECLAIASRDGGAKWISGATDLSVESNLRFRRWPHLISLESVPELREFTETPSCVCIGSALPLQTLESLWTNSPEAVKSWVHLFASPPIRNRATLGGSLGTASPIGDAAPMLMALNASLSLSSVRGERSIALSTFFPNFRQTLLAPDELIRNIEIPKPFPALTRFYKVSKRRIDDISTVAAGFSIDQDEAGRITRAIFAFGGVAAVPLRATSAEQAALGQPWNESTVARIQQELGLALVPKTDHRGSSQYRLAIAKSLVEKFFGETSA